MVRRDAPRGGGREEKGGGGHFVRNNGAPGAETHCAHPLPLCSRDIEKGQRKLVNKRPEYSSPSFPPFSQPRAAHLLRLLLRLGFNRL
ncbi:MAG: hypothetical protein BJ554DRAFT_4129 [Olpidium bornovanus]|uniref:Uncharacterized protein n=1 Tax=Olpidium bornovanus TaxID=278681 RepID=A0A8H7ZMJ6_9FUNG|nr:MAG: hypothetical protein BJ554DRAFT_4129 [Olpidium bornovanus]